MGSYTADVGLPCPMVNVRLKISNNKNLFCYSHLLIFGKRYIGEVFCKPFQFSFECFFVTL